MGWHHQTQTRGVHSPYRWIVNTEADRLAITTNADGSEITALDGQYCKCLQLSDNTEWVVVTVGPIAWQSVLPGASKKVSITNNTVRKTLFTITVPENILYPGGSVGTQLNNVIFRKQSPNIAVHFEQYTNCLFKIQEISLSNTIINEWIDVQFSTYPEFIDFLNANMAYYTEGETSRFTNRMTVSCYVYENQDSFAFRRLYGINRFFSCLRGRDNYKKSNQEARTISYDKWTHTSAFVDLVYQAFFGFNAPPVENSHKTFWVPQTNKQIYNLHRAPITFQTAPSGSRRYFHSVNRTTYAASSGGTWIFEDRRFVSMAEGRHDTIAIVDKIKDKNFTKSDSVVMISMYKNSVSPEYKIFLVKPVGMDMFHLGFESSMIGKTLSVYAEYEGSDTFGGIRRLGALEMSAKEINYGMNTSYTVQKQQITAILAGRAGRRHLQRGFCANRVRFFYLDENGIASVPSKWISYKSHGRESNVLLLPS